MNDVDALRDPLFSMVEIEINSRCNRRCSYCPNAIGPRDAPRLMTPAAFERVLARLHEVGFTGRLSYHFYNEPLLHPQLPAFVRRVATVLPAVRQILYTNGDFLTDERHRELLEGGISRFIVTQHDGIPGPPREAVTWLTPGLLELTNRAGTVDAGPAAIADRPCFAPASMLVITIKGNVVLCYEDSRETTVLGNVFEQPLAEIWWSPRFVELRRRLATGERSAVELCRRCNNRSHPSPDTYDFVY